MLLHCCYHCHGCCDSKEEGGERTKARQAYRKPAPSHALRTTTHTQERVTEQAGCTGRAASPQAPRLLAPSLRAASWASLTIKLDLGMLFHITTPGPVKVFMSVLVWCACVFVGGGEGVCIQNSTITLFTEDIEFFISLLVIVIVVFITQC